MMFESNIRIENAKIAFRNFSGKEGKFNPAGRRNFCVIFDQKTGNRLKEDGWNIRYLKSRDEDEPDTPYLQVAVSFDNYPPRVVLITNSGKTTLDEESVNILDWAEIDNVDLIIRPYNWELNGRTGTKAYLKAIYVTLSEDEFESKYCDVPDSGKGGTINEH